MKGFLVHMTVNDPIGRETATGEDSFAVLPTAGTVVHGRLAESGGWRSVRFW